jgi:hypothetical protein
LVGAFDSAGGFRASDRGGLRARLGDGNGYYSDGGAGFGSGRNEANSGGKWDPEWRRGVSSGWFGFRFGLGAYRFGDGEFLRQFLERLRIGALGDSDEPVHARQRNAFESCIGIGVGSPEARFRFARAAKAPIVLDERIDQKLLDLGDRPELSLVVGGQGFEFGEGFTGEDGFFGVDARFDRV